MPQIIISTPVHSKLREMADKLSEHKDRRVAFSETIELALDALERQREEEEASTP
jgi:hypothetical protein